MPALAAARAFLPPPVLFGDEQTSVEDDPVSAGLAALRRQGRALDAIGRRPTQTPLPRGTTEGGR